MALKAVTSRYFTARGGRKTAAAVARIFKHPGGVIVNEKDYKEYFRSSAKNQKIAIDPLSLINMLDQISATVRVNGGGINAQAEAVRNAIARALVRFDESLKLSLKKAGFLKRDSRMVERKKYGLKKARRAPQWAKR